MMKLNPTKRKRVLFCLLFLLFINQYKSSAFLADSWKNQLDIEPTQANYSESDRLKSIDGLLVEISCNKTKIYGTIDFIINFSNISRVDYLYLSFWLHDTFHTKLSVFIQFYNENQIEQAFLGTFSSGHIQHAIPINTFPKICAVILHKQILFNFNFELILDQLALDNK